MGGKERRGREKSVTEGGERRKERRDKKDSARE